MSEFQEIVKAIKRIFLEDSPISSAELKQRLIGQKFTERITDLVIEKITLTCRWCDKKYVKTTMDNENGLPLQSTYYCSQLCYDEAWYILSALYEFHNHDPKATWKEFEEAVWGIIRE